MNSNRDWSVDGSTYTPNVTGAQGLQWVAYGSGCSMPSAGATTGSCSKGTVTFSFSRPVSNPRFHVHDFGGRMEANCKLAIQGTMALAGSTPGSVTFTKLSGGIGVSGTSITGRAATAPMVENNHASGTVQINGLVSSLTFNFSVILTRQGTTCDYDNNTMLMSAQERLNATFSYGEDYGDGPATYDASSAATHVIGNLSMGSATVSEENSTTLNSGAAPVAASPLAGANANGDNDDAISGSPTAANIGQAYSLVVPISGATAAGQVCGFIDMNASGTYTTSNPDERACATFASGASSATLTWAAGQWPGSATPVLATGLRLRIAYGTAPTGAASPTGPADSGEVEDHRIRLNSPLPPVAESLTGRNTVDVNQTFTPTTSQGAIDNSRTCVMSGATCVSSLVVAGEGTWTVNGNGTITFDPLPGFTGPATPVSYRIEDSSGNQSTATIAATVTAPPVAVDDSVTTPHNTAATRNVLSNDTVHAGNSISTSSTRLCGASETAPACTATSVAVAGKGTFLLDTATGVVTFTPLSTFTGTATVEYVAVDNLGARDSGVFSVLVLSPAAPTASPASSSGLTDVNQTITLPADAGAGTSLDPLQTCIVSGATCVRSLVVANEGTYTVNANGTVTFDPLPTFTGPATVQTYRVEDVTGQRATASLSVTVTGQPTVQNDTSSGAYDVIQTVSPLANDSAGSGATLDASSVRICAAATSAASCSATSLTVANEGTYTVNANGTVSFDPLPTFTGTATAIRYVVVDSVGQRGTATIRPSVAAPDAPAATGETKTVARGGTASFTPVIGVGGLAIGTQLVSGTGAGGPCLVDPADSVCKSSVTVASQGTWAIDQTTGAVQFVSLPSASTGTMTPITYRVTDVLGRTATAALTPIVAALPGAVNDAATTSWDALVTVAVLTNDTVDPGLSKSVSSVRLCGVSPAQVAPNCSLTTVTIPGQGTYSVNADGTVSFDPLPSFTGVATPVNYQMADSAAQISGASLSVSVSVPAAPTAKPESKSVAPGASVTFTAVTGASGLAAPGAGGPALLSSTLCLVDPATNTCGAGPVAVPGVGRFTLDPETGRVAFAADATAPANSTASIAYRITDDLGRSASASLSVTTGPRPVAVADKSQGPPGASQSAAVLGNDTPGDATRLFDPATVRLCGQGETQPCSRTSVVVEGEGTFSVGPNGVVSFEPDKSFTGVAKGVMYSVADALGATTSATYVPTVLPPPAPVARPDVATGRAGTKITADLLANDSPGSVPGSPSAKVGLVIRSVRLCAANETVPDCASTKVTTSEGAYTLDTKTGIVTFVPVKGFTGTVTQPVTYQVRNDWKGASGPGTSSGMFTPTVTSDGVDTARAESRARVVNRSVVSESGVTATLDPLVKAVPSSGASWRASTLRIIDSSTGKPVTTLSTSQGTWRVVGSKVLFMPADGFAGRATVRFTVADSAGKSATALLAATVTPVEELPLTGSAQFAPTLFAAVIATLAGSLLLGRRRVLRRALRPC